MAGIGIIHNPFAKGNLKRPWVGAKLSAMLEDVGVFRETKNINELPDVAQEFKEKDVEIIAVNGGDGTLHLVLSAFVKAYGDHPLPKVMSLRGGTMNTVSNSLKIKGKTVGILEKAVQKYKAGEPFTERQQHLIKVNEKYGFLSGAGTVAKFLDAYYSGSSTGPWQATKLVAKMINGAVMRNEFIKDLFGAVPCRVSVDGNDLGQDGYNVMLGCTIVELGLGFKPTPHAYDKPGHFHFVATTAHPIIFAKKAPTLWKGGDVVHPEIQHNGVAATVTITPSQKMRWMIDGELYDTEEPLHYSVGPTITMAEPA